ncbi:MAG: TVP38/TMEM64 family protein [Cyanobacteria bacterium RM1_2_2]|nr:TVP38/TMEM64 family protein [Cyanobacteria bacterium RM1_2_2]
MHQLKRSKICGSVLKSLKILGFAILSFLITAMPAIAANSTPSGGWNLQEAVQGVLSQIQQLGAVGALAFIVLYAVAAVAFIPGSLLTLGAGFVYGVVQGSFYVFIGASLGAVLAFLVGRYLARDWVARKIQQNSKFRAIDEAVGREGFKIVLLTRLSPVFPFNLLNYAFGITGVSLRDYALGCVGMLPGTVLYVYLGSLAGDLATLGTETPDANPALQWAVRGIGFAATLAVTLYVTKIARKALAESVSEEKFSNEETS